MYTTRISRPVGSGRRLSATDKGELEICWGWQEKPAPHLHKYFPRVLLVLVFIIHLDLRSQSPSQVLYCLSFSYLLCSQSLPSHPSPNRRRSPNLRSLFPSGIHEQANPSNQTSNPAATPPQIGKAGSHIDDAASQPDLQTPGPAPTVA